MRWLCRVEDLQGFVAVADLGPAEDLPEDLFVQACPLAPSTSSFWSIVAAEC